MAGESGKNVAQVIFEDLREKILRDALRAGERLPPERELARTYGTNRNTLREAIRRLEQARLVSVRHGQGVTVLDFRETGTLDLLAPYLIHGADVGERIRVLLDILRARAAVLQDTVALAAERATGDDIARLRAIAEAQEGRLRAGDRAALARGDLAWLEALLDAAHSVPVRSIANTFIEVYRGVLERFPSLWVSDAEYAPWMHALVDALEARAPERASALVREGFARTDLILVALLRGLIPEGRAVEPDERAEES